MRTRRPLILAACGDVLLHGRYDDIAESGDADQVFRRIRPLLAESDIVVGNLETILALSGTPREDKLCLRGERPAAFGDRTPAFRLWALLVLFAWLENRFRHL